MAEELGMRMRLDGVVETSSGIALTGTETEKMAKKLDQGSKALDGMGMSAKQTRQAMRELPMQFTDIATSLAGGMPAWLVFIQQGGQIRDRFGGAVPALRAIGSLMTPLAVGAGGAAAALGVLTLAYVKGESEAQAFHRALILTGNAAGVTADQMTLMSQALAQINGTQAQNAAAMAELASTGRVAGDALEMATRAAVGLEKAAGIAVKDTVAQFAQLGKDPVKAAASLNEQTNFLTKSLFDQVQKLKDQGKETEAATLVQKAYAESLIQRSDAIKDRLGNLEKSWRNLGTAASWAWDKMLNVGRKDTNQEALEKLSGELEKQRLLLQRNLATGGGEAAGAPGKSQNDVIRDGIKKLEREAFELSRAIDKENTNAKQKADEAAKVRDYVENKLNPKKGKETKPLGAIRTANEQYRSDFLRSEVRAYDSINEGLEFDNQYPKADVSKIIAQRDAIRAARVAELQSYDAVEKKMREDRAQDEAKARADRARAAEEEVKAIEKARDAWEKAYAEEQEQIQKRRDTIADSIYDGILNGFRNGQSPAEIFLRELKAQFARTVLKVPVQFLSTAMDQAGVGFGNAFLDLIMGKGYSVYTDGMGIPADIPGNPLDRRANGGSARARGLMEVAEEGPELLRVAGRSYLMMGNKDGYVHSASATRSMGGGRSMNLTNNINIDARTDQAQVHQLVVRAMQQAQSDLLQKMDRGEV